MGLATSRVPPSAATRSRRPFKPASAFISAPPTPLSRTSTVRRSAERATDTAASVARAWRATFASASDTTKYAVLSTLAGGRGVTSTTSETGSGARATTADSAASRPRSDRIAG